MKTTVNHKTSVKTICILLTVLACASAAGAYPPDNAAVLYYKAFLMLQEPSEEVKKMMQQMREGKIKSNDQIKQHLQDNRNVMEFAEDAAEILQCDWGYDISRGLGVLMPELLNVRFTAFMFTAKAQILAEEDDYKAALSKCLTIHKMARHVSNSLLISYLVGTSLNNLANQRIDDFLSIMPEDLQTLSGSRVKSSASRSMLLRSK